MQTLMENNDVGIIAPEPFVADAPPSLDPEVRRRLVRSIMCGSTVFLVSALAKIPFVALLAALFFLIRYLRGRLDPVEALVVVLAVAPWLGPYIFFGYGLDFNRVFVVLAFATLWSANGPPRRRFFSNGLDIGFLVFILACALSAAFCFMWRHPFRNVILSLLIPFAYYQVAKNCIRRLDLLPKLYVAAVIGILGFGSLGLLEGVIKVDIMSFGEPDLDPFRANGPMRMPEEFGVCMSLLLLFFLGMRSLRRESQIGSIFLRAVPVLGLVSCYLSLLRGIWIALGAGWLAQTGKRDFGLFLRVTPVLAIVLWLFLKVILPAVSPEIFEKRLNNEGTINARIATYQSGWAMFKDYPILGVGFSAFNEMSEKDRYQFVYKGAESVDTPHNNFMALLSETGLVGTLSFVFFLFQAFRCALRVANHGNSAWQREYGVFVFSAITAYVVAGAGLHIIRNIDFINKFFFIFLGILSGLIDELSSNAMPDQSSMLLQTAGSADFTDATDE